MLTVIHTFNGSDQDRLLADIHSGLETVEDITGFKFASLNKQEDTKDIVLVSKWDDHSAYQGWAGTIGENNAFKQATPQFLKVIDEKY